MDKFRAKVLLEQKRDQLYLESFMRYDNIQKSKPEDINPFDKFEEDIQKGKPAAIGETRMWGDKKVRKQANGKWVEVSEHGMTKKEHKTKRDELFSRNNRNSSYGSGFHGLGLSESEKREKLHHELASKLSDKEYTDEEVEGGGPKYEIGSTYHLPAPEGGEAIDMKIISFKNN